MNRQGPAVGAKMRRHRSWSQRDCVREQTDPDLAAQVQRHAQAVVSDRPALGEVGLGFPFLVETQGCREDLGAD